jgi:hypothetical protein
MKRADLIWWGVALLVGILLTVCFQEPLQIASTFAAWCLVCGIWQVFGHRFVASDQSVSKMSTDQATQYLRLTVRRILLTIALALVIFLLAREYWGLVYWLSIAGYYQIGIALTIREAWRSDSTLHASTNQA